MGCGSSQVSASEPEGQVQSQKVDKGGTGDHRFKPSTGNGVPTHGSTPRKKSLATDSNSNTVKMDLTPVPKPVAFDVTLEGQDMALFPSRRPLPRRLQVLEPLDLPKLSAEQLEEKQRLADEKRSKLLQTRASSSKRASRRRQELLKAKEFEMEQQLQQEKAMEDHLKMVEVKREAKLREIQDKQRLREERAKRARERAKRLNNPDEHEDIEIEKEENPDASDNDSWLGDDASSPQKRVQGQRPTASAGTVDSYDAAFQRQPQGPPQRLERKSSTRDDDDFFGS